jgi:signal transduction histidine kinase
MPNSASDVVNRVRALFKHSTVATVPLNLNEVIEEVRQLMLDEASGGNVRIETDLEPDLPRTLADRVQMQQVMVNLVRNGIEAMDATRDVLKLLSIRSRRDGSYVRVDVCDRGSGTPGSRECLQALLYDKKTGMGMGLAICRSIIEAHRGRLWATQNEGWGTTFCFTLPILSERASDDVDGSSGVHRGRR